MKIKKLIMGITLVSVITVLSSCGFFVKEPPRVEKITAVDADGNEIKFTNGDVQASPSIRYLYITFDKEMNTQYGGYVWYNYSGEYIINYGYVNSRTYYFEFSLLHDTSIKVILNDPSYITDDFNEASAWLRSKDGVYLDEYILEFTTKKSPNANTAAIYEYDINSKIYKDWLVDLAYNEYGKPANLQAGISVKELFMPERLKKGDVLKIKYKIYSDDDLPEIIVNLVDISAQVDYWKLLADEKDIPLTKTKYVASTTDEPNYYTGEVVFHVTEPMTSTCTLQFTCKEFDDPENHVVQFTIPTDN